MEPLWPHPLSRDDPFRDVVAEEVIGEYLCSQRRSLVSTCAVRRDQPGHAPGRSLTLCMVPRPPTTHTRAPSPAFTESAQLPALRIERNCVVVV